MPIWTVREEFVRTRGATGLSSEELDGAASRIVEQLPDADVSAHGRGDRFVVSAKVAAPTERRRSRGADRSCTG
jgi:hypothetical protein